MIATTFRLRQFFPARISRAAAAITSSRNAPSIAAAAIQPIEGRQANRRAPGDPDREQRQERRTLDRQASRPVWNGRQKEAGHDGRHEAVEHLVDMPVARSKRRGEFELAVEHRQPGKHRKSGIERAEQEEGAKAIGKKRGPLVVTEARNAGHRSSPTMASPLCLFGGVRVASSLLNRLAKICFARPGCVTAFACASFSACRQRSSRPFPCRSAEGT